MNQLALRTKLIENLDQRAEGYEKALSSAYRRAYESIEKELLLLVSKNQLKPWEIHKFNRLSELRGTISKILGDLGRNETVKGLKNMVKDGYTAQCYELTASGVNAPFVMLRPEVVEASVWNSDSTIDVIKTFKSNWTKKMSALPEENSFLSRILDKNNLAQKIRVWDSITSGITQGLSYKDMSRNMRDVFEKGHSDAMRVLRTEGHKAQMMGQLASVDYAVRKGVDVQDFWISSHDSKTRKSHQKMDGQKRGKEGFFIFPWGERTVAPAMSGIADEDINCRCRLGHIVDGISPNERRVKNPVTGRYEIENLTNSVKAYEKKLDTGGLKDTGITEQRWLKDIGDKGSEVIMSVYKDMSPEHKAFWKREGGNLNISLSTTSKGAYFSSKENRIVIGTFNKPENPASFKRMFFHEAGHFFDHRFGGIAVREKDKITDLLKKDFKTYVKTNFKDKEEAGVHIITTWRDLKYSSASDLVGALTKNRIRGYSGHATKYWKGGTNMPIEAFAHIFQAEFVNSEETEFLKSVFPTTYGFVADLIKKEIVK